MITPILEKLLLEQKAVYKTHNHGLGGVGTIFNPDNRTMIITDITYHPFIDGAISFLNTSIDLQQFLQDSRFIHTLKLQAKENILNYTFKDNFKLQEIDKRFYVIPDAPVKLDCFFIANEDVHINIKSVDFDTVIPNFVNSVSPPSNEENIPLGYGTSNNPSNLTTVLNSSFTDDFSNIYNYFPVGNRDALALATATAKLTEFIALYKLSQGGGFRKGTNNFPIITFGYVMLNSKYKISDIIPKH